MNDNLTSEFFGIGIQNGKTSENLGVLWRSAQNLGTEDHRLSKLVIEKSHVLVKFKSQLSLNVSVAGSIVMYDRGIDKPRS